MGPLYRVRQFFSALRPGPPGGQTAVSWLNPAEQELFQRLAPAYRRHALAVQARLLAKGIADPDLLRAALLHDVGKSEARIRLHHRVANVLLARFAPRVQQGLGASPVGWRRPFYAQAQHAALGARLAGAAGSGAATVWLIAHHHDPPTAADPPSLLALRQADGEE